MKILTTCLVMIIALTLCQGCQPNGVSAPENPPFESCYNRYIPDDNIVDYQLRPDKAFSRIIRSYLSDITDTDEIKKQHRTDYNEN